MSEKVIRNDTMNYSPKIYQNILYFVYKYKNTVLMNLFHLDR